MYEGRQITVGSLLAIFAVLAAVPALALSWWLDIAALAAIGVCLVMAACTLVILRDGHQTRRVVRATVQAAARAKGDDVRPLR